MRLFRRSSPPPDDSARKAVSELMDGYHHRASIVTSDHELIIEPGKVLENITLTMERLDNDIETPVGVSDAATFEEITGIVQMRMGWLLALHVVNTAMQIMTVRYPEELVSLPLPEHYDVRKLYPLTFTDEQHETARRMFNQRISSAADLRLEDIAEAWEPLDDGDQVQVFTALFFMFGSKVGAMKYRTGIQ